MRNRKSRGLKFCNHCGTPLKSMARCAKYGFDNAPGARFCGECGGALSAAVQAGVAAAALRKYTVKKSWEGKAPI